MRARSSYRKRKTKENLLTSDEIRRLLASCKTLKEKLVVYSLLYAGLRVSEFIHMNRDWIDWNRSILRIPESQPCNKCPSCRKPRYNKKGKLIKPRNTWVPKTKNAVRSIVIDDELYLVLLDYFASHKTVMETISSRGAAYYIVKKVARRCGLEHKLFPHALRGTRALTLAKAKFSLWALKDFMGWKNIDVAADYVKLAEADLQEEYQQKIGKRKIWEF